jgi:hypothetical protein
MTDERPAAYEDPQGYIWLTAVTPEGKTEVFAYDRGAQRRMGEKWPTMPLEEAEREFGALVPLGLHKNTGFIGILSGGAGQGTSAGESPAEEESAVEEAEASPEVIGDLITLATGVIIPGQVIATWTPRERDTAVRWASAEHLHASDNIGVRRLPQPELVRRAIELAQSPALAQLAAEAWVTAKERLENSTAACAEDLLEDTEPLVTTAQDAITGLLVLLGERRPS